MPAGRTRIYGDERGWSGELVQCLRNSRTHLMPPYRHSRGSGNPELSKIPGFRLALAIASLAGMTCK